MTRPFIGIDFGTCNSSAAWFDHRTGQAEVLTNAEGYDKTPSVVYFGLNDETVVGQYAEERLESPDGRKRVLIAVKRDLARPTAWLMGDRRVTPLDAAALILAKIRLDAEELHFQRQPVVRAVIAFPAIFTDLEKDKLREAAMLAGFREVELVEEPVAAAHAYTKNGINVGSHVLVYDLGGGTFDLAVLAREDDDDTFRVALEPRGEKIGGEDFDRAIYDHFEARALKKTQRQLCPDGLDLHLLRQCRRLKERLSASEAPGLLNWYSAGTGQWELELRRQRFETLIEPYVERTVRLTQAIHQDAARDGYPVDSVILIGGASRTPCIVQRLQATLQLSPQKWHKQDVAVALGAAYHAQRLWGETTKPAQQAHGVAEAARQKRIEEEARAHAEKERQQQEAEAAERQNQLKAKAQAQFEQMREQQASEQLARAKKSLEEAHQKQKQREIDNAVQQDRTRRENERLAEEEEKQEARAEKLKGIRIVTGFVLIIILIIAIGVPLVAALAFTGPFAPFLGVACLAGLRKLSDAVGLTRLFMRLFSLEDD